MDNVLFLVAHPDDFACAMGGTALLLKDRCRLHVLCATKGERGLAGRKSMRETARIREREEAAACALAKARLTFLGHIDREVFAGRDACLAVASHLRRLQPVALFAMWPVDAHPDHSAVSEIARKAIFLSKSPTELLYAEADVRTQTSQFHPDLYVDISARIEDKLAMIRCHHCQNSHDGLAQVMRVRDSFRGAEIGVAYAEGFKTVRPANAALPSRLHGLLKG